MDTKRFFTSMLIAGALMLVFMYFFRGGGGGAAATTAPMAMYKSIPAQPTGFEKDALGKDAIPDTLFRGTLLGGADAKDKSLLAVKLNNVTAGIDSVQLNIKEYAATYKNADPLMLFAADSGLGKPFSTIGIHITVGNQTKEIPFGSIYYKTTPDGMVEVHQANPNDSADDISAANSINMLTSQYVWQLDDTKTQVAGGVTTDAEFYATFTQGEQKIARITKHFHLDPASYEMTITHTVTNLTADQTIHVGIDQLSAPALARDDPQTDDRFFHAVALNASNPAKKYVDGEHGYNMIWGSLRKAALSTKDDKTGLPKESGTEYIGGKAAQMWDFTKDPNLWVASSNRFFALIVRPLAETGNTIPATLQSGQTIPQPAHVASANIDLMKVGLKPADDLAIIRLTGRTLDVDAGKSKSEPIAVYMGPKKRGILLGDVPAGGKPEYATYDYIKLVQFNTCALYSFCVFDQVAYAILWVLDFLKGNIAFGNYGVAIMILVIAVRAILHPLTRASQVNMAKMGKQMRDVQPQMEAMKKKYADNKKKQSEETMRIYRENKINPAGGIMGCLPMLIQMPIWAALYSGLRSDIDLRHAAFIPGWINDLASPDKLFPQGALILGHPPITIPLIGEIYGFNLLPILLAGVFFFQMKVTSATQPKPADEQQAQMAKMSQYMIFIFPLFLYNAPSGLNLYIFASTMGGLLDTYLVRKTLKKQGILTPTAPLLPTREGADNE